MSNSVSVAEPDLESGVKRVSSSVTDISSVAVAPVAQAAAIPIAAAAPTAAGKRAVAAKPPQAAYAAGEAAGAQKQESEMSSCQRHYKGWIWGIIIAAIIALIVAIVCCLLIPDNGPDSGAYLPADSLMTYSLNDDYSAATPDLSSSKFAKNNFDSLTVDKKLGQLNQYTYDPTATGPATVPMDWEQAIAQGMIGSLFNMPNISMCNHFQQIAKDNGVPPILMGYDTIHGYWTIVPANIGLGASFDRDLVQKTFNLAGYEAHSDGIHQAFSPMLDISRDSRWGRLSESFGEDPVLTAELGRAAVRGHKEVNHMSCVKHFAGYGGAEAGRDYNLVDMSPERAYGEYLVAYKAAIDEGAMSVMTSFNSFNYVPSTGNRDLLTNLLKKAWGFKGLVVADYTAVDELVNHGLGKDKNESSLFALTAGLDMEMAGGIWQQTLKQNVEDGVVDQSFVDAAAQRILYAKESIGLGDMSDADSYIVDETLQDRVRMNDTAMQLAMEAAERSMVLLKNGKPQNMTDGDVVGGSRASIIEAKDRPLPLTIDGTNNNKVLVIGSLANSRLDQLGNWHGHGEDGLVNVSTIAGFLNCAYPNGTVADNRTQPLYFADASANTGVSCTYLPGYWMDTSENEAKHGVPELIQEIADFFTNNPDPTGYSAVFYALGEAQNSSGEATSRSDLNPCCGQMNVFQQLNSSMKAEGSAWASVPLINVVYGGRGMSIEDYVSSADATIMAWFPGTAGGPAFWNLVTNKAEHGFVGRVSVTFPRNTGQCPIYYARPWTGRPHNIALDLPTNDPGVHYSSRYIDVRTEPLFNFGHGLSYSKLDYDSHVTASGTLKASDPSSKVTFTTHITNNGGYDAYDIPQLYIHPLSQWGVRRTFPKRLMKGFQKVQIRAGTKSTVSFELTADDFGFYNNYVQKIINPGDYEVFIGPSNDPDWDRMTYYGYPLSPGGNVTYTIQA